MKCEGVARGQSCVEAVRSLEGKIVIGISERQARQAKQWKENGKLGNDVEGSA